MKKLPEIGLQLHPLFDISNGRIKTQLLVTAIELNIFDYLSTPQSSDSVARQLNTHSAYTHFLLDGLSALHLLEKKDDKYQNLPDTQRTLHTASSTYVGAMFTMMDQTMSASMTDLTQKVVSGPQEAPTDLGDEALWQEYSRSMANFQRCGPAQHMAAMISKIDGFAGFQKMMDLGGGPGLYCIAMVAEHPNMQGVIFDQPAVVNVAEEFIAEYDMQDRVSTVGGDYINDHIGEGFDLIWASATLNFVRSGLTDMCRKIHRALNPGGVFVSLADGTTHERTRPENYVLTCLPWMFSGHDVMFNSGEIAGAMKEAGFSSVESRIVESPMMPMELDIARK